MFKSNPKKQITLREDELLLVRKAQAHEETGLLPSAESDAATTAARHALGSKASAADILVKRAGILLEPAPARSLAGLPSVELHTAGWTAALMLTAFVLGALLDQIAGSDKTINLLAPTTLLLLIWNLAVYAVLLATPFLPGTGKGLPGPARRAFMRLTKFFKLPDFKRNPATAAFLKLAAEDQAPILKASAARAFHLGALAFATGLVVSTLVRGVGTHWSVGWESTWFSNDPPAVHSILQALYGWLPFTGTFPGVETIASLEFTSPAFNSVDPAPWIGRLIELIACVIIIPRALLALWNTMEIRVRRRRMPLDISTPYFRAILKERSPEGTTLVLTPSRKHDAWKVLTEAVRTGFDAGVRVEDVDVWSVDFDELGNRLAGDGSKRIIACLSAGQTPEPEVHGAFLEVLARAPAPEGAAPLLLLDVSTLDKNRRTTREALWKRLADEHSIDAAFVELPELEAARAHVLLREHLG